MSSPIKWTDTIVPNGGTDETRSPQKIEDNKWTSGVNVEPLFDGVRRRQGSVASNERAYSERHDILETDPSSDQTLTDTVPVRASSFTVGGSDISVGAIEFYAQQWSGSPTGTVDVAIYSDDGSGPPGDPNAFFSGADFSDFSTVQAENMPTGDYDWVRFSLTTPVTLTNGTIYHLLIRHVDAGSSDRIAIQRGATLPAGGNNAATAAGPWTPSVNHDFRIFGPAAPVTMIADYRVSDGTTSRHLAVAGGRLFKNVGGVITEITEPTDAAAFATATDTYQDWTVGQDRLFITDGNDTPKKFYILSAVEYYENEGIAKPTATASASLTAGGGTDAVVGTFEIDFYYWNSLIGQPSDRRYNGVSALSIETTATTDAIVVSALPTVVARTGDAVTDVRIEVKDPSATVFRYATSVTLGTAVATLDVSSGWTTTTAAEYRHAVAPDHSITTVAENRKYISGITANPYRVMHSDIIGTTPYYESYPANNFRDFGRGDGDYVTALFFMPPRTLVVGCRRSVWSIDARNPGSSDRFLISKEVGIAHHNAGQVIGGRLYFISDAPKNKGPYVWSGQGEPQYILGIDDTFKSLSQSRIGKVSCAQLAPGDNRFQWWTLVTSSAAATHDTILVYDWALSAWTKYTKSTTTAANVLGMVESTGNINQVIQGGYNGFEYISDTGSTDAGEAFMSQLEMKLFDFGAMHAEKRMRFTDYVALGQTAGNIGMSVERDLGTQSPINASLQHITTTGAFVLGTSTLGSTDAMGASTTNVRGRVRSRGRGRLFRPSLSETKPWHLKAISFAMQMMKRR